MSIDSNNKYCLTSRHEIKFIYKCINKIEGRDARRHPEGRSGTKKCLHLHSKLNP